MRVSAQGEMWDDREQTIADLMPFAAKIADDLARRIGEIDHDAVRSDAYFGLMRAVDAYNHRRGSSLEHFVAMSVRSMVLNGSRNRDPVPRRVREAIRQAEWPDSPKVTILRHRAARFDYLRLDKPGDCHDVACSESVEGSVTALHDFTALRDAILSLERNRQIVIRRCFFDGATEAAVARELRLSPQRIYQLKVSALKQLRRMLTRRGYLRSA